MFVEPFGDDVPTDKDNLKAGSDIEWDWEDLIEPLPTDVDDGMED